MSRTMDDGGDALSVATALLTAAPFSFLAWAKTNDGVDNAQVVVAMTQAGTANFWVINLKITTPQVRFNANSTAPAMAVANTGTAVPSVDVWAHYAAVEAASDDRSIYLDGGNKGTNTDTVVPLSIDTISIGENDDGSPGDRFNGDIGHAALYNTPLSDQEVETLAAGFNPRRLHIDNLVGYWPVNGQNPEYNVIGTGANLALVGTPAVAEEPPIANFMVAA